MDSGMLSRWPRTLLRNYGGNGPGWLGPKLVLVEMPISCHCELGVNFSWGYYFSVAFRQSKGLYMSSHRNDLVDIIMTGIRVRPTKGTKKAPYTILASKSVVSNASTWDTAKLLPESSSSPAQDFRNCANMTERTDSFMHLHLGIDASGLPSNLECHHFVLNEWGLGIQAPQNVCIVSIPTVFDPSLAPAGCHVVHAYTAGNEPYSLWKGMDRKSSEYAALKEERSQVLNQLSLIPISQNLFCVVPISLFNCLFILPYPYSTCRALYTLHNLYFQCFWPDFSMWHPLISKKLPINWQREAQHHEFSQNLIFSILFYVLKYSKRKIELRSRRGDWWVWVQSWSWVPATDIMLLH